MSTEHTTIYPMLGWSITNIHEEYQQGADAYRMWSVVHPGDEFVVNQCRDSMGIRVTGCYCSQMRRGYG